MIKWTLTKRIWLSFITLILIIGLIVGIIYPFSLEKALKEDSFQLIKREQSRYIIPYISNYSNDDKNNGLIQTQHSARDVGHLIVKADTLPTLIGNPIPVSMLNRLIKQAEQQKSEIGDYQLNYEKTTLFYIVHKVQNGYVISFMRDTYTKEMAKKLWTKLFYVFLLAVLIALILTVWLTRYLKSPLVALGNQIEEIAKLNWKKPFEWKSGDEFQKLSDQFEHMRQNLVRYDTSQKHFLQRASHEMKTPIMVIQSYAQSVKDGMYPKEQLAGTMDVIIDEAALMEKRVQKLLYYTKVDSLRDESPEIRSISFGDLAETIISRFSATLPSIKMTVEGANTHISVDEEQWLIVMENLVENALRYAKDEIKLWALTRKDVQEIHIQNDGEPIPEEDLADLFKPFTKGIKGQFGLGLAIVKRIVDRHDGQISVNNTSEGVDFTVTIPI